MGFGRFERHQSAKSVKELSRIAWRAKHSYGQAFDSPAAVLARGF